MQLDHINISAPIDLLQQVRDFYCAVLGLREGPRPNFSRRGFWLYAGDRPLVHLTESGVRFQSGSQGHLDHVAFRSGNLAGLVERLESSGVSYTKSHLPDSGMTQIFFTDPAGVRVEVNAVDEN